MLRVQSRALVLNVSFFFCFVLYERLQTFCVDFYLSMQVQDARTKCCQIAACQLWVNFFKLNNPLLSSFLQILREMHLKDRKLDK